MGWQHPVAPPRHLAHDVACSWSATVEGDHRLLPDGCTDVLWLDTGAMVLCGPDTEAWDVALPAGRSAVGVRLRPGAGPRVFRTSATHLTDRRIPLEDVVGSAVARRASERIDEAEDRVAAVTSLVAPLVLAAPPPQAVERVVVATVGGRGRGPVGVSDLADEAGVTSRQLLRRSLSAFGYGPSVLGRIARLQRLLRLAEGGRWSTLADLAARAGYSDHAHLARECKKLTDRTPSALLAAHTPTFPPGSDPYKTMRPAPGNVGP